MMTTRNDLRQPRRMAAILSLGFWAFAPSGAGLLAQDAPSGAELTITRLGNAGFALAVDGRIRVLIDALYGDGIRGYEVVPEAARRRLERAQPPYDDVRWVLASHVHGDHFDPRAVAHFLSANAEARFLSTPQAVAQLRTLEAWRRIGKRVDEVWPGTGASLDTEHAGIPLRAVRLHHGTGVDAQNLGLIVDLADSRVLHMGDTEASLDEVRTLALDEAGIDVVLAPYWYFFGGRRPLLDSIGAAHRVVMHLAAPDAPSAYFAPATSRPGQERRILEADPAAILLGRLESHRIKATIQAAGTD